MLRTLRYLWAFPATAIGLLVAAPTLLSGGGFDRVDGVIEVYGGFTVWFLTRFVGIWMPGGASAMTLGHVVLGRTPAILSSTRIHERVHVRQYEKWGPFFLPAYGLSSLIAWWKGLDSYRDNIFEIEAYAVSDNAPI